MTRSGRDDILSDFSRHRRQGNYAIAPASRRFPITEGS
jgi:hypothetical protein